MNKMVICSVEINLIISENVIHIMKYIKAHLGNYLLLKCGFINLGLRLKIGKINY